ncbi:uncharacterized protein LOC127849674 [Dreissena polymorpha]|uniref:uncharacterized protein LOC127849674 n=1 Tax=Dreissena polymorpha TaxID=45954 RepID=UPI002264FEFA|nr:uncharacterized protein LOC127849674 [Dreissena polymorpha]
MAVTKTRIEFGKGTAGGSTYTRWGRTTCSATGTLTVYSGYAAGSHYTHQGAAVNYLCLTKEPLWSRFDASLQHGAPVYGAEYEFDGRNRVTFFDREITDHDAPCAVCESPRSQVLMIPGRNKCLAGWTLEYQGYLVAGDIDHVAASEFICLDANPESLPNDSGNTDGKVFYFAEARCGGSLKCPPYVNGRELTCVVCTK